MGKSVRRIVEKYYLFILLALSIIFFAIAAPRFFTVLNLTNILV